MFQNIAIGVTLLLTVITIVMVVRAVRSMLGVIRLGQPAVGRTDRPARRTLTMLKETVLHTRMLQWTWVGVLHWFAFAAFIALATAVGSAYFQLFSPEWTIPWLGKFFVYEWVCELLGLLGTLGIIPLIVYRLTHLPSSQGRRSRFFGSTMWQAFFVEAMVLLESVAILFIRGAEKNLLLARGGEHAAHATGFHFPISQLFSHLYPSGPDKVDTLENIVIAIALIKIVSALAWLMVVASNLTMGVAWHRFTAWFNIWFKRESTGRPTDGATTALGAMKPLVSGGKVVTLDDIDDLDEDARLGVGTIGDFAWKGILDFTTCTECGRCQSQCPAWNTEKPLSPKLLVMGLREHAYAAAPYLDTAKGAGEGSQESLADLPLIGKTDKDMSLGQGTEVLDWFYNPADGGFVIDEDVLWSCTSCGACVQQCPVDIEHVDHIMDMRRYQVLVESNFPTELNGLFKGLENKGNPWNMSANARMDWAKDLPFEVKVVGEDIESLDEVDWLFWVGCAGAYEDRAKKTTRAVAELLDMAGISFGVLGNGETCTGDPARRAGNEFVFQGLAAQNVETFKEFKVKQVVSTCAHCFNTLRNEYKDFGIELEVVHHTQLLNRLVREGKLTPVDAGAGAHKRSITYHDPCYIGRHNGVYTPPRELLQVLPGADYVEMPRNSERSFCCGAGGARMWMEERIGQRINRNRTDEAVATGADQIAVGCPFCRVMLSDGLTAAQADGSARESVEVLDVAQMLLASVKGEQATKLAPGQGTATAAKVATAAEPSAGDVTASAATLTETADAGAAAKAHQEPSGGSSLFDTPAPSAAPARAAEPAGADAEQGTPTAPTPTEKPASGGSLFDEGGSLFDTPSAPAAEPAPAQQPATGGSLFDEGSSLFDTPSAPAAEPAPAQQPATGGSLFDIPATTGREQDAAVEPAAKAEPERAPETPAAADDDPTPAPSSDTTAGLASGTTSQPRTDVDLGGGGSLFDIEAPQGSVVPAPAAPAAPTTPATPTTAPTAAAGDGDGETPSADAPTSASDASTATPSSSDPSTGQAQASPSGTASGTASQPRTDVDLSGGGSLFDIEAPQGPVAPAPAAQAAAAAPTTEPAADADAEPDADAESSTSPTSESSRPAGLGNFAPVTEANARATEEAGAPASAVPVADVTPETEAPRSTSGAESRASSAPHTDVDLSSLSSLFDIEAPQGGVDATATSDAPAGADETAPPATAVETAAPATEDEAPAPAEANETAAATTEDDTEQPAADDSTAGPATEDEGAAPATDVDPPAATSGEAHTPRKDVDIQSAGSLFDL